MHKISFLLRCKLNRYQYVFKISSFVIPLLLPYNCHSQHLISSKERISQIHNIEVVAMEPPPLAVSPDFDQYSGVGGAGNGYGDLILLIIWGIKESIKAPELKQEASFKTNIYKSILLNDGEWTPTIVLVNQVSELLKRNPGAHVTIKRGVQKVPGTDLDPLSASVRKNWYSPLLFWYRSNESETYSAGESSPDAFLLVGINYYVLQRENLSFMIYAKLIDGKTGIVIRKSMKHGLIYIGGEDLAFSNNETIFKEKFSKLSYSILEKNLQNLKIIR